MIVSIALPNFAKQIYWLVSNTHCNIAWFYCAMGKANMTEIINISTFAGLGEVSEYASRGHRQAEHQGQGQGQDEGGLLLLWGRRLQLAHLLPWEGPFTYDFCTNTGPNLIFVHGLVKFVPAVATPVCPDLQEYVLQTPSISNTESWDRTNAYLNLPPAH